MLWSGSPLQPLSLARGLALHSCGPLDLASAASGSAHLHSLPVAVALPCVLDRARVHTARAGSRFLRGLDFTLGSLGLRW